MPCCASAMLRQCRVLHVSPGGSQKITQLLIQWFNRSSFEVCCCHYWQLSAWSFVRRMW